MFDRAPLPKLARLLAVAATLSWMAPLAGAAQLATEVGSDSMLLRGELALSVQDAIEMALENNLDIAVERHDPLIARLDHTAARGAYDPTLFAGWSYGSEDRPSSNPLDNPGGGQIVNLDVLKGRTQDGEGGLSGLLPFTGASYELVYEGTSTETDSSFPSLTPEYRTTLRASATLPVLKGFLVNEPWLNVRITGLGRDVADAEFARVLMDTVRDVEQAYWNLVAARDELRVANKSLEAARALREQTQAQYEVGVVSRVDVVESDAGVAEREEFLIRVRNALLRTQDLLINLTLGPDFAADSELTIRPTSEADIVAYDIDRDAVARRAFQNRPELVAARRAVDQGKASLRFARNERLPQLDLIASYGYTGLAGKVNPRPFLSGERLPGNIPEDYGGADDDFFRGDGANVWSAGAVFTFPIGNRSGRANATKAELELRRSRTRLRQVEQQIVLEVRDAVRQVQLALERIEATARRREAATEQLRAENIRLENGESTPFDVLLREEDLVEAESQEILAVRDYRAAVAALDRAQGTILADRGVAVEAAMPLR